MTKQLYLPDNTQSVAQYTTAPFRRYEIRIDNVDRSQGQFFPHFEGDMLFIDRADWPALVSLVSNSVTIQTASVGRVSTKLVGPFKGLMITHPLLTGANAPLALRFNIGQKNSSEDISGSVAAFHAAGVAISTVSNNAGLQAFLIAVPPGSRVLSNLEFTMQQTTVTQAIVSQAALVPPLVVTTLQSPTWVDLDTGLTNSGAGLSASLDQSATPVTGLFKFKLSSPLALLCYARYVYVQMVGSVLSIPSNVVAVWQ